ncbi:MAG: hypothetical protein Q9192_008772, partial [Flavoplaca navasiana]
MRMDEVWKRATYRRSTFTLEEPEIQRTKFGLTQLKQVMVEFGTESRALELFEEKDYDVDDVDDSDEYSDDDLAHQATDSLVAYR